MNNKHIYIYQTLLSKATYKCIQAIHLCQYVHSLGIEPTTFCAANPMLYHWSTGTHIQQKETQMCTPACIYTVYLHFKGLKSVWTVDQEEVNWPGDFHSLVTSRLINQIKDLELIWGIKLAFGSCLTSATNMKSKEISKRKGWRPSLS